MATLISEFIFRNVVCFVLGAVSSWALVGWARALRVVARLSSELEQERLALELARAHVQRLELAPLQSIEPLKQQH